MYIIVIKVYNIVFRRVARNFKRGVLFKIDKIVQKKLITLSILHPKYTLITPRRGDTTHITCSLVTRLIVFIGNLRIQCP